MKIVQHINDMKSAQDNDPEFVKFWVKCNNGTFQRKIVTYNKILDHIKQQQDMKTRSSGGSSLSWTTRVLSLRRVLSTRGPRSIYWSNGKTAPGLTSLWTSLPKTILSAVRSMPRRKDCWTSQAGRDSRQLLGKRKKLTRMINQAKRKLFCEAPKFMFGYQVLETPEEALEFDKKNGNTKWADAIKLDTNQLFEYKTFVDYGKGGDLPKRSLKIRLHWVFAVKHDGRHKARCVAGDTISRRVQRRVSTLESFPW